MGLVVMREQARLQKNFAEADAHRDSLSALGVTLSDRSHSWRAADGRTGRIPTFSEIEVGGGDLGQVMDSLGAKAPPAYDPSTEEGRIKTLVNQREEARAAKDYARSDDLREQLKALGVELFDKEKMWRTANGLSGVIIGYGGSQGASDTEIHALVMQREKARQSNDYETADMIRHELKEWGVDIHDKDKTWRSSDGRHGQVPSWGEMVEGSPQAPSRMGGMSVPKHEVDQLMAQVMQNLQNPALAPRAMHFLQQAAMPVPGVPGHGGGMHPPPMQGGGYGGKTSSMMRSDSGQAPKPGMAGPPRSNSRGELPDALKFCKDCQASSHRLQDIEIEWLVGLRERLRKDKDYSGADTLREGLRAIGLELGERDKMWKLSDGRTGVIPEWKDLS